jgi:hypothetical protein
MNNTVSESHEYFGGMAGLSSSVEERKKASELRKKTLKKEESSHCPRMIVAH